MGSSLAFLKVERLLLATFGTGTGLPTQFG
jgi:hypothetical protein